MEPLYPIKVVARRTALSPHLIRTWEKRYGAVSPARTATNRRLYSDEDVERLRLLHRATLAGHSIGQIARLPTDQLMSRLSEGEGLPRAISSPASESISPDSHLTACLTAVERFDGEALEAALTRAAVALSQPALLEGVVVPLMHSVGQAWHEGTLRMSHEHLATAILRTFLGSMVTPGQAVPPGPFLVATTPAGQMHELGALTSAVAAASEGWRTVYLGPNLPAEEIAQVVHQNRARAVALSITHPADDPRLGPELLKLRRGLGNGVAIIVGGRAASGYDDILKETGATVLKDLSGLRAQLESLRNRSPEVV